MTLMKTHARFADTSHTLLGALTDPKTAKQASDEIARIYWPPVYAYLRHSGLTRDQAADLTQSFFAEKMLRAGLLQQADPNKGRIRSLILTALKNFAIDEHRKEITRGKKRMFPIDAIDAECPPRAALTPEQAYQQRWASVQLGEAMRRCEDYFRSSERPRHWDAFADRIYHPAIHKTKPTPLKELSAALGFATAADVGAAVQLVKKRAISFLRAVVAESVESGIDSHSEFKEILRSLQQPQAVN